MKRVLSCFVVILFSVSFALAQSFNVPCVVKTRNGKPLNVKGDNGRIVSKLKNGTRVYVVEVSEGDAISAYFISLSSRKGKQKVLGWVDSRELKCEGNF